VECMDIFQFFPFLCAYEKLHGSFLSIHRKAVVYGGIKKLMICELFVTVFCGWQLLVFY
jgi:hypothetical protein